MTLGELIYQYRMDQHMSQRAFATKCGVSNVYINMLEKNLNPSTGKPIVPTMTQLKAIADAMGYTLDEITRILDPESVVTVQNDPTKPKRTITGLRFDEPWSDTKKPYKHLERQLSSRDPKKEQRRPVSPIRMETVQNPHVDKTIIDVDLTITVEDDSMYPTYQKNDILYIKEQPTLGFDGQIMAVMIDANTTVVRHVYEDPRNDGLMLVSDNPSYPTEYKTYKEYPALRLVGWVCGFTRLYDLERWYRRD